MGSQPVQPVTWLGLSVWVGVEVWRVAATTVAKPVLSFCGVVLTGKTKGKEIIKH